MTKQTSKKIATKTSTKTVASKETKKVTKASVVLSTLKALGLGKTMPRKKLIAQVYGKELPANPIAALGMIALGIYVNSDQKLEVFTSGRGADAEIGLRKVGK
jgi:hypothetical protein